MIWFKNTIIYQLNDLNFLNQPDQFNEVLAKVLFKACAPSDKEQSGFVAPFPDNAEHLFFESNEHFLLRFKKETKLLPPAVLKQHWLEKIQHIEAGGDKKLNKAEKLEIKEQLLLELLPKAFSKLSYSWIWIDKTEQKLIIDTTSFNHAELILATLRKALGSLSAIPFNTNVVIEQKMKDWVLNPETLNGFELGDEAKLVDQLENVGIIQVRKQELIHDEITIFLKQGKWISQLQLIQKDQVSFILHHDFTLKRLQFTSELIETNRDYLPAEKVNRDKADFILMTQILRQVIAKVALNLV